MHEPPVEIVLSADARNACGVGLHDIFSRGLMLHTSTGAPIDLGASGLFPVARQPLRAALGGSKWDRLREARARAEPFEHALLADAVPCADAMLRWLMHIARWRQHRQGFYCADVTSLDALHAPADCASMFDADGRRALESAASALFGQPLKLHGPISAHRLSVGQGIGIHADTPLDGEETHRIVLMLVQPMRPEDGGHFLLLRDRVAQSARIVLPLRHNTAIAFRLTERSFHAVSTVTRGERFSVVISLR